MLNGIEGAAALREFIIRVTHPDPDHASKINLRLRIKYVIVGFCSLDLHSHRLLGFQGPIHA